MTATESLHDLLEFMGNQPVSERDKARMLAAALGATCLVYPEVVPGVWGTLRNAGFSYPETTPCENCWAESLTDAGPDGIVDYCTHRGVGYAITMRDGDVVSWWVNPVNEALIDEIRDAIA